MFNINIVYLPYRFQTHHADARAHGSPEIQTTEGQEDECSAEKYFKIVPSHPSPPTHITDIEQHTVLPGEAFLHPPSISTMPLTEVKQECRDNHTEGFGSKSNSTEAKQTGCSVAVKNVLATFLSNYIKARSDINEANNSNYSSSASASTVDNSTAKSLNEMMSVGPNTSDVNSSVSRVNNSFGKSMTQTIEIKSEIFDEDKSLISVDHSTENTLNDASCFESDMFDEESTDSSPDEFAIPAPKVKYFHEEDINNETVRKSGRLRSKGFRPDYSSIEVPFLDKETEDSNDSDISCDQDADNELKLTDIKHEQIEDGDYVDVEGGTISMQNHLSDESKDSIASSNNSKTHKDHKSKKQKGSKKAKRKKDDDFGSEVTDLEMAEDLGSDSEEDPDWCETDEKCAQKTKKVRNKKDSIASSDDSKTHGNRNSKKQKGSKKAKRKKDEDSSPKVTDLEMADDADSEVEKDPEWSETGGICAQKTRKIRNKKPFIINNVKKLQISGKWKHIELENYSDKFKVIERQSTLQKDRKSNVSETLHHCLFCNIFESADKTSFTEHLELHINGVLKCQYCDSEAVDQRQLLMHYCEQHGYREMSHVCHICGFSVHREQLYRTHMATEHQVPAWSCKYCSSKFITYPEKIEHMAKNHADKVFPCDKCQFVAIKPYKLKFHHQLRHDPAALKCQACDKVFSHKSSLNYHTNRVHKNIRRYPCPHCSYSAKAKTSLTKHILTHTG